MRKLLALLLLLALVAGAVYLAAGRAAGPAIDIAQPAKFVGQSGELAVLIDTPRGAIKRLDVAFEQDGARTPLVSFPNSDAATKISQEGDSRVRITHPLGKRAFPAIKQGKARIIVTAVRPVLFGLREATSTAAREIDVRLTPPRVGVISLHHFVNHAGSEMVVYNVTPADAASGVKVGDHEFPGFPAANAGVANADPTLRVAFFALTWDQDLNTPISVFARDEAGNEGSANFDYRVFPKPFRKSNIPIDDNFLNKVVPAILQGSPDFKVDNPADLLQSFLHINRDLRKQNNATIASMAQKTDPHILWKGTFKQLANTAVEANFADQRTYFYKNQEVDKQVHLGFDLASTQAAAVVASNRGRIVFADYLGIYGNCVIIDHGMGVQSLYGHLSQIAVKPGDMVELGQQIGRSGSTGMAGGDHLHFTMLVGGQMVTPVDWWSDKWIEDRILRKLREAGHGATPTDTAAAPGAAPSAPTPPSAPAAPAAPAPGPKNPR
jgi:murein DD-endopeptidase MepM/ murein hydrolase activator NlpD